MYMRINETRRHQLPLCIIDLRTAEIEILEDLFRTDGCDFLTADNDRIPPAYCSLALT